MTSSTEAHGTGPGADVCVFGAGTAVGRSLVQLLVHGSEHIGITTLARPPVSVWYDAPPPVLPAHRFSLRAVECDRPRLEALRTELLFSSPKLRSQCRVEVLPENTAQVNTTDSEERSEQGIESAAGAIAGGRGGRAGEWGEDGDAGEEGETNRSGDEVDQPDSAAEYLRFTLCGDTSSARSIALSSRIVLVCYTPGTDAFQAVVDACIDTSAMVIFSGGSVWCDRWLREMVEKYHERVASSNGVWVCGCGASEALADASVQYARPILSPGTIFSAHSVVEYPRTFAVMEMDGSSWCEEVDAMHRIGQRSGLEVTRDNAHHFLGELHDRSMPADAYGWYSDEEEDDETPEGATRESLNSEPVADEHRGRREQAREGSAEGITENVSASERAEGQPRKRIDIRRERGTRLYLYDYATGRYVLGASPESTVEAVVQRSNVLSAPENYNSHFTYDQYIGCRSWLWILVMLLYLRLAMFLAWFPVSRGIVKFCGSHVGHPFFAATSNSGPHVRVRTAVQSLPPDYVAVTSTAPPHRELIVEATLPSLCGGLYGGTARVMYGMAIHMLENEKQVRHTVVVDRTLDGWECEQEQRNSSGPPDGKRRGLGIVTPSVVAGESLTTIMRAVGIELKVDDGRDEWEWFYL